MNLKFLLALIAVCFMSGCGGSDSSNTTSNANQPPKVETKHFVNACSDSSEKNCVKYSLDYPASWKQESFPKFDQTSDLMQFAIPRFFAGTDGAFSADGKVAVFGNCPESEPLGLLPCKGEPGSVIKISGYPSKGAAEDQKTLLAKLEKVRSQSSATEASNGEITVGSYRGFQVLQNLVRFKHRVIILPQNGTGLLIQVINSGQTTDTEQIEAVLASLKIG